MCLWGLQGSRGITSMNPVMPCWAPLLGLAQAFRYRLMWYAEPLSPPTHCCALLKSYFLITLLAHSSSHRRRSQVHKEKVRKRPSHHRVGLHVFFSEEGSEQSFLQTTMSFGLFEQNITQMKLVGCDGTLQNKDISRTTRSQTQREARLIGSKKLVFPGQHL